MNMKQLILLLLCIPLAAIQAHSQSNRVQVGDLYYLLKGEEATVTNRNGGHGSYGYIYEENRYDIPRVITYNNQPYYVTGIGLCAFAGSPTTTVVLPEGIKNIEQGAFGYECMITSMVIPTNVEDMWNCFNDTPLLRSLVYTGPKPPKGWVAVGKTYVPDMKAYSSPNQILNNGQVVELISFSDTLFTYNGNPIKKTTLKCNAPGWSTGHASYYSPKNSDAGYWCDTVKLYIGDDLTYPRLVAIPYRYRIQPAKLKAKVTNVSREYGTANPTVKVTYSGFVNNENAAVLEEPVTATIAADENSPVGTYEILLSGGKAKNYDITYEPGTLTVTKAPLTASVKNVERTYGTPDSDFQITYVGLKNGEQTPTWVTAPAINTSANQYSDVGDYVITAKGGIAQNYDLPSIASGRLTITKAPLTVRANNSQRFYFQENPSLNLSYDGFVNGESEAVLAQLPKLGTSASKSSKAGIYPITVSDGIAKNYDLSYLNGQLTVMKRSLTVTSPDYTRAYGEDNPTISLSYGGFVNNETETALSQAPQAKFEADKGSDVGTYSVIIDGGEADNYDFVYRGGKLTITKANQTLTWDQDLSHVGQGDQVELTARASSGLDVSYIVPDNSVLSLYRAGTRTLLDCFGEGSVQIRAVQEGNKNYYSSERLSKTVTVTSPTGIGQVDAGKVTVHTSGRTISINGLTDNSTVLLHSADGRLVYQGTGNRIRVEPGCYLLKAGGETLKIIVE